MFATAEQDLVPDDQNGAEGVTSPDPGLLRSLVLPVDGAVGVVGAGYPRAFQAAMEVAVEDEDGHKVAQPAAQGNWNFQPGEKEEEEEEEMISETDPGLVENLVVPVEGAVEAEGTGYPRASQAAMEEEDEEDEEEMNETEEEEEDYYYFDLEDDEDEEEDQYDFPKGRVLDATVNYKVRYFLRKHLFPKSVLLFTRESRECKCEGSEEEVQETESEEEEEEEEESEDPEEGPTTYLDPAEGL